MNEDAARLALLLTLVVAYSAAARRLDRLSVTSAIVFTAAGLALGSKGLDVLPLSLDAETTRLAVGDLVLDLLSRKVTRAGQPIDLRPREFALLEYLMRNAGTVVSKTMILSHVWEYNFDPQTNVVDVLVSRLRDRIDRPFETKLLRTARGVGYVLGPA